MMCPKRGKVRCPNPAKPAIMIFASSAGMLTATGLKPASAAISTRVTVDIADVGESAVCLITDCPDLSGGVYTTAPAMGAKLNKRRTPKMPA